MLIELRNVGYTYLQGSQAAATALDDISLTIGDGEFVGLIGPTGSGKSTLAQIMSGLIRPTNGAVVYEGADIWRTPKRLDEQRSRVGMIFQEPEKQLFEMTVAEDVAFWPKSLGVGPDQIVARVEKAMLSVGLDYKAYRHRSPFTLSGGEMRRVAIAGILVMDPQVLVLDEPTVGLDPRGKIDLMEKINKINDTGTSIVLISHDMDLVAEYAGRVVLLDEGRIKLDDIPREVFIQAELLRERGLEPPVAAEIARRLEQRGFKLDGMPLTVEEIQAGILKKLGGTA